MVQGLHHRGRRLRSDRGRISDCEVAMEFTQITNTVDVLKKVAGVAILTFTLVFLLGFAFGLSCGRGDRQSAPSGYGTGGAK